MIPLPLLIALLLFALAGLIIALAYLAAPVIHDRVTVEPVDDGRAFGGDSDE